MNVVSNKGYPHIMPTNHHKNANVWLREHKGHTKIGPAQYHLN